MDLERPDEMTAATVPARVIGTSEKEIEVDPGNAMTVIETEMVARGTGKRTHEARGIETEARAGTAIVAGEVCLRICAGHVPY
jgi:hypothetical protein